MRSALFVVICLALSTACSRVEQSQPVPPPADSPTTVGSAEEAEETGPPKSFDTSYPEKDKVLVLIHRAQRLKREGQFEEALALVEEALVLDPHSPQATTLRQELVEIVVRIKDQHDGSEDQIIVSG